MIPTDMRVLCCRDIISLIVPTTLPAIFSGTNCCIVSSIIVCTPSKGIYGMNVNSTMIAGNSAKNTLNATAAALSVKYPFENPLMKYQSTSYIGLPRNPGKEMLLSHTIILSFNAIALLTYFSTLIFITQNNRLQIYKDFSTSVEMTNYFTIFA